LEAGEQVGRQMMGNQTTGAFATANNFMFMKHAFNDAFTCLGDELTHGLHCVHTTFDVPVK
jgi:hypothetical protein